MPNGYGRGFGFRGSSPPWPFVGIGRGGLPRCGSFLSGAARVPVPPAYPSYGGPWAMLYYRGWTYPGAVPYGYARAPMGADPYAPQMTREQELDSLRSQAKAMKVQLEQIDARIKKLETE